MTDELLCQIEDGVATITLNRPDKLNAITLEMGQAYDACMARLSQDKKVRVVLITGAGRGFCAGADAGRLQTLVNDSGATLSDSATAASDAWASVPDYLRARYQVARVMPQPVIAAINGACAGAGLALAISCDIRLASSNAFFSAVFAKRGLIAESGLAWTLPRLIGRSAATEMMLSGRRVDAADALRIGLVNTVIEHEQFAAYALSYARDIAANGSPRSLRVIKEQLRLADEQTLREAIQYSGAVLREALTSSDFHEGVAALREKRQPRFTGD
ncbi:MAG: enoyl-CoA hydratase-related protein [Caulobacterales bacterium]